MILDWWPRATGLLHPVYIWKGDIEIAFTCTGQYEDIIHLSMDNYDTGGTHQRSQQEHIAVQSKNSIIKSRLYLIFARYKTNRLFLQNPPLRADVNGKIIRFYQYNASAMTNLSAFIKQKWTTFEHGDVAEM